MRYARVTRSGPELCRARRRRVAASGDREGADAHGSVRCTTVTAATQPVPRRRRFLLRPAPGVPQDGEWPADCVKIAASTYNSPNVRSRTPRRRPRRISSSSRVSARFWPLRSARCSSAGSVAAPPWRRLVPQGSSTTTWRAVDARAALMRPRVAQNSTIAPCGQIVRELCAARGASCLAV